MKLLTKGQLAKAKGVSVRTVDRWLKKGCPSVPDDDGRHRFDIAAVNAWLDTQEADPGADVPPSAGTEGASPSPLTPRDPLRQADMVRKVNQARRSELELAAERGLKDLGFDAKILAARTFEDYAEIDRQVAALLARGAMTPDRARAIMSAIGDARQNTKAHRDAADGQDDLERFALASDEALRIVEAFEGIVSDERRAKVLEHVLAEAAADLAETPNVDLAEGVPEEPETNASEEEEP